MRGLNLMKLLRVHLNKYVARALANLDLNQVGMLGKNRRIVCLIQKVK